MNPKSEIIIVLVASLLSLLFWESSLVFPIKIFVVMIHEFSHAIMTIFTGGNVEKILLNFDLSGITQSKGGSLLLIAAAGYPGSLIIGVLLYLSADNLKLRKWMTNGLAITFLLLGINFVQGGLQVFLSLVIALAFFLIPRYLNNRINSIILRFIGLTSCLYVISDIKQDLLTTTLRETDTQILEYLTDIPSLVLGLTWFLVSVVTVFLLIRRSYLK
ncbi:MAG: M50 family metallopeptidase [Melioribacteraceae bacterium]|nr:M50 family metallopeptidase [Melioribacteraceae bacterium]